MKALQFHMSIPKVLVTRDAGYVFESGVHEPLRAGGARGHPRSARARRQLGRRPPDAHRHLRQRPEAGAAEGPLRQPDLGRHLLPARARPRIGRRCRRGRQRGDARPAGRSHRHQSVALVRAARHRAGLPGMRRRQPLALPQLRLAASLRPGLHLGNCNDAPGAYASRVALHESQVFRAAGERHLRAGGARRSILRSRSTPW